MPVKYNNKYIIPAPLVTIAKDYNRTDDNTKLSSKYIISIKGTLLPHRGSPNASGVLATSDNISDTVWTSGGLLGNLERKQYALRNLFSQDGYIFSIESLDDSETLYCYPKIDSITFDEGVWTDRCNYSIGLSTNVIYTSGNPGTAAEDSLFSSVSTNNLQSYSESWKYAETDQDDMYNISHNVNAKGLTIYDGGGSISVPAWEYAQQACSASLVTTSGIRNTTKTLDSLVPTLSSSGYHFNLSISEDVNEFEGTCSISEQWIFKPSSDPYIERYSIVSKESTQDPLNNTITMDGSITGLAMRANAYETKYGVASGYLPTVLGLARDRIISRTAFDNVKSWPSVKTITYQPYMGQIQYSLEYEAGPLPTISGAYVENISVNDTGRLDVFASLIVPGRYFGPVHQNMNTFNAPTRTVNVTCIMNSGWQDGLSTFRDKYLHKPDAGSIVSGCKPEGVYFKTADNESWEPNTLKYSRNVTWTLDTAYQSGVPSGYGYADYPDAY